MDDHPYIKSLLLKFWADECTPEETEAIINYLKTADRAEDLPGVEEMRTKLGLLPRLNKQRADDIFNKIVDHRPAPMTVSSGGPGNFRRWAWPIAAAFVGCLLLAGAALWYYGQNDSVLYRTQFGQTKTVTLPDGTEVMLNANSKLRVPAQWPEDSVREVWLAGEAFFSVRHTADHRKFVVNTSQQLRIEVLGTQFNVNSRDEKATVVLNAGKVKVRWPTQQVQSQRVMKPGDLVEYQLENQRIRQKKVDTTLYTSWRRNLLVFEDTPLEEIARLISNNYGYEVEFKEASLARLQFTGSVPADQPELLLTTLARSFDLDISEADQQITIGSP